MHHAPSLAVRAALALAIVVAPSASLLATLRNDVTCTATSSIATQE